MADVFGSAITGENKWRHRGSRTRGGQTGGDRRDMYQVEHDEMFATLRAGKPINNGEQTAGSTLLAIMGRVAAYTGQIITPDQVVNSKLDLSPAKYEFGPNPVPPVPVPGVTKFARGGKSAEKSCACWRSQRSVLRPATWSRVRG
jgi:hypothetical protein